MKPKIDKRIRILNAAVTIFAKKGFYNSKVADIAKKAGVADGTIYLYFKNKDEILIMIFEEEMEKVIAEVKAEVFSENDILDNIRKFILAHLTFVKKNPRLAQVFQLELRQSNKFIKEYTGTRLQEYLNIISDIIHDGQQQGVLNPALHPGLVKRALFGALDEVATHWILSKNVKYNLDESAEQLIQIFINGLRISPNGHV